MRFSASALLLGILSTTFASPAVVDTIRNISYVGFTRNGSDSFLNIPFGQDTGLNRFGPPKLFVPTAGTVFNNTVGGKLCPQRTDSPVKYSTKVQRGDISEDCLNLLVVRPNGVEEGAKLPVMV